GISLVRASVITTLYASITVLLQPISYGPVQVRVSDALSILPYIPRYGVNAVIGLALGTLLANIVSPYGVYDIVVGTTANLVYSLVAWVLGRILYPSIKGLILVAIEEIIITSLFIGYILLHIIYAVPLEIAVSGVAIGSTISQGVLGFLLGLWIIRREKSR
ncbi:MAG: QueT transporter family protein, partial [Sulfolobales archaeon]